MYVQYFNFDFNMAEAVVVLRSVAWDVWSVTGSYLHWRTFTFTLTNIYIDWVVKFQLCQHVPYYRRGHFAKDCREEESRYFEIIHKVFSIPLPKVLQVLQLWPPCQGLRWARPLLPLQQGWSFICQVTRPRLINTLTDHCFSSEGSHVPQLSWWRTEDLLQM